MEAATAAATRAPTHPPGDDAQRTPEPEQSKSHRGPVEYLVFEAPNSPLKKGDTLTYLDTVTAEGKKEARWAVVDKIPDLQQRVQEDSDDGGVYLLAIAERHATPALTVEEVVKATRRR